MKPPKSCLTQSCALMRSPYLPGLPSITNYSSLSYPSTSPRFVLSRISPPLWAFRFVRQKPGVLLRWTRGRRGGGAGADLQRITGREARTAAPSASPSPCSPAQDAQPGPIALAGLQGGRRCGDPGLCLWLRKLKWHRGNRKVEFLCQF